MWSSRLPRCGSRARPARSLRELVTARESGAERANKRRKINMLMFLPVPIRGTRASVLKLLAYHEAGHAVVGLHLGSATLL